ncbi:MAG: metallophosphoesterase [Bacteroidetes bacterium]|nr:metallophosphoesterase [Bacteroidota bacterium]
MKQFFFNWFFLVLVGTVSAQNNAALKFNDSGEFKIIQFTDTHVNTSRGENLGIFEYLQKIIQLENPDLVVITGDIVTEDNPQKGYMMFVKAFQEAGVPWVMVFGNHDSEHNISRKDLAKFLQSQHGCLNKDEGETDGNSNFILTVSERDNKTEALLYFMDSNDYSTLKPRVGGWGWFTNNQVEWYRAKSKTYTMANGGTPYPAIAFFHIPFPEYELAMKNKKAIVMGTFAGHDHYNDYIVTYYDLALAYGRASKLRNQHNPDLGGRVIVLKEGKREFDTWIRDMHGAKEQVCNYPASFAGKK